ncbi:YitT family protein [Ammoniphilus sp. YIM 78166]|uniref:YczE/YyaS/YitT family protein n=1 Tax=Ammoniphilus sp. YIM 78166 TaxID=1644106 RepID=UPI00106F3547|nr:YitT family protein [Ammoniphilus sp. YIM 78166]
MGKRIAIYLGGLGITSLGMALIILPMVGAGPWDAVAVGLTNHFGFTVGMWSIVAQTMVVLFTGWIERKRPSFGSFVTIVIRSWMLDAWIYLVLKDVDFTSSWEMQWISLFMGVTLAGVGMGIYLEARFPRAPIDGLMIALHNRFGWTLTVSRTVIEFCAAFLGFFLGGPIGFGTIVVVFLLGKVIQVSNQQTKKVMSRRRVLVPKP